MPLQRGDTVERYLVERLLGVGGMGEVYQARDTRLQRAVALKILRDDPGRGDASRISKPTTGGAARMLREARAAAALDHPNVVAIFDVGSIDTPGPLEGTTYLAMELIKGSSLRAFVGDAQVPMGDRVRWLTDVARALAAAHHAGLVHRDIKPENVMIREDGQVKVLDFGIARRTRGPVDPTSSTEAYGPLTTAQGVVLGTPLYMAPEQLRAEPLDGRADQFAWGVVAYELLAGKAPWSVDHGAVALVGQILGATPRPLGEIADVPAGVAAAVTRALEKSPGSRFASMDAVVEAMGGKPEPRASVAPRAGAASEHPDALAPTQQAPSTSRANVLGRGLPEGNLTPSPSSKSMGLRVASMPAGRSTRLKVAVAAGVALAAMALAGAGLRMRAIRSSVAARDASSACTSNEACIAAHGGEPWICRSPDRACVRLASEDCSVMAEPGDAAKDSTVWLGLMLPSAQRSATLAKIARQATDLARRDFAATLGQVESARRIGVVSCETTVDPKRAARHLAEDLRVPAALLGTTSTDDIVEIVSNIFTPAGLLTMIPHSTSPLVTALPPGPSGRLVYRSTFDARQLVDPLAALVDQVIEPQLEQKAPGRAIRVAYVHPRDVATGALSERVMATLRFNGKSAVDNGDDFRDVTYAGEQGYAAARDELARFRPAIVIAYLSRNEEAEFPAVIGALDEQWQPAATRPVYLFTRGLSSPEVVGFIAANADRRRRFLFVDTLSNTNTNAEFVSRYNEMFDKVTRIDAPNNIYDGFYALAYAVHALGDQPVTGPAMASAFRRLAGPGKVLTVGPHAIFDAYKELRAGATIDLEGAGGHLDLDPASGESSFDFAILCMAPAEHDAPPRLTESGLVYSPANHGFSGALKCR